MGFGNTLKPLRVAPVSRGLPRGVSIHIGLNHVDPNCYNGFDGQLDGCINDANDMKAIADSQGFQSSLMIDSQATASAVINAIGQASQSLTSGDILLLTYSGHGGTFADVNGDEDDGQDETWVLWDRQVLDDELYALWSQFAAGVRIFVLSDSCHSGTVVRMMAAKELYQTSQKCKTEPKFRLVTREDREKYFDPDPRIRALGEMVQYLCGPSDRAMIQATVLLISGCLDNQLSADGTGNGLFTEKLKQVWSNGAFSGDYRKFWQDIRSQMPLNQLPNYFVIGANNPTYEQQKPFTIGGPGAPSTPSTPATTTTRRTIRRGDSGPDVTYLQQRLQAHGQSVSVDGIFGGGTEAQVMNFQRSHGLPADGVVGPNTWRALDAAPSGVPSTPSTPSSGGGGTPSSGTPAAHPTLSIGSQGPAVQHLQQLLIDDGATLVADGFFGQKTASAVRAFQSTHGLTADGVVGPATWAALEPPGSCRRSADELVTA